MLNRIAANRFNVGYPSWRVALLAIVAKLLGIQCKIDGMPFGASYKVGYAQRSIMSSSFADAAQTRRNVGDGGLAG